jgi:SAM-dependent methyltransferase
MVKGHKNDGGRGNLIKINFGCGPTNIEGWINLDSSLRHIILSRIPLLPKILNSLRILPDYSYEAHKKGLYKKVGYCNVTKKTRFRDESVDFIYTSHLLEHLYPKDAEKFIKECKRILKKKGLIRILVPDLEKEAKDYIKNLKGGCEATKMFNKVIYACDCKAGRKNGHNWMYDLRLIENLLKRNGFQNIIKRDLRKGKCPDITILDKAPRSLIIEAEK